MTRTSIGLVASLLAFLILPAFAAPAPYLPNPATTPGALNPHVTQANIKQTICVHGWTSTVRPSSYFTTKLKRHQIRAWGYADRATRDYEEDHLTSLEIGGAPSDPKNLWPEPYAGQWGARTKDKIEDKLHRLVCAGKIPLKQAQQMIRSNWIAAYKQYIGR